MACACHSRSSWGLSPASTHQGIIGNCFTPLLTMMTPVGWHRDRGMEGGRGCAPVSSRAARCVDIAAGLRQRRRTATL